MVDKSIFMATQNWIKTYVIQILPVLALIVYIIGFVYYMVYYYQFGINITSYITLAEVLVSTLTPILIVVMLSVAFFGLQFLSRVPQKQYADMQRIWNEQFHIA